MKKETLRQKLIDAIFEHSEDELEEGDWFIIAKESEDQLVDRVIHILNYYHDEYNAK